VWFASFVARGDLLALDVGGGRAGCVAGLGFGGGRCDPCRESVVRMSVGVRLWRI
jgi:hypothetical protein